MRSIGLAFAFGLVVAFTGCAKHSTTAAATAPAAATECGMSKEACAAKGGAGMANCPMKAGEKTAMTGECRMSPEECKTSQNCPPK